MLLKCRFKSRKLMFYLIYRGSENMENIKQEEMTVEKAWDILNSRGIYTIEELDYELKKTKLEIGMFTMPFVKENVKEA